jgi:hypothetical protein
MKDGSNAGRKFVVYVRPMEHSAPLTADHSGCYVIALTVFLVASCLGVSAPAYARQGPPERHHSIEALVFDGPHQPFGVGVRIGRLKRRLHDVHPGIAQQTSNVPAPFPITITDQHAMLAQQAVTASQRATDWAHEAISRMRRGPHRYQAIMQQIGLLR